VTMAVGGAVAMSGHDGVVARWAALAGFLAYLGVAFLRAQRGVRLRRGR
jgi:hypothetical protein